jgi:predicted peroxiredoxin
MSRPPLAILLVTRDPARLRAALTLGRAEVALDGSARLFLQGEAAELLRPPVTEPRDAAWIAAGEPALADLLDAALDDGVQISLCQSGLAMAAMDARALDRRIALSGPLAFLAEAGPDIRLLTL